MPLSKSNVVPGAFVTEARVRALLREELRLDARHTPDTLNFLVDGIVAEVGAGSVGRFRTCTESQYALAAMLLSYGSLGLRPQKVESHVFPLDVNGFRRRVSLWTAPFDHELWSPKNKLSPAFRTVFQDDIFAAYEFYFSRGGPVFF
jgi:hypothetical protein